MLFPKYVLEDLSIGSGFIIGKSNIEEFFDHISMHKDIEEKPLAELAPSLNPFMQYMFLKLHDIEDPKKKTFILETPHIEFRDVAIEAREVFKKFNKLGSPNILECQYLVNLEEFMMLGKRILVGFVLKILLMKVVYQSVIIKDLQKLIWKQFNSLLKRLL
jgi:hypothetical protein